LIIAGGIEASLRRLSHYDYWDDKLHPSVLADKNMIFSVLQNLISNAIKFTKKDGRIEISGKVADDMISVVVSDNGIGMSAEARNKLFKVEEIFTTPGTRILEHAGPIGRDF